MFDVQIVQIDRKFYSTVPSVMSLIYSIILKCVIIVLAYLKNDVLI